MKLSSVVFSFLISTIISPSLSLPPGPLYAKRLSRHFDNVEPPSELLKQLLHNDDGPKKTEKDPQPNTTIAPYPIYRALTDFDYASFNLVLYQEYIELDLFHNGLAKFSEADFDEAGINNEYRSFINFMANQEVAHAQLVSNILGPGAAQQCSYEYPFTNVREFIDFCQRLTRWGESGVYGFLSHLNSRDSATLLTQSITTEARQQMAFRQMLGAPAITSAFITGTPQTWAWTLLAPYITSCPKANPKVMWSNYPTLKVSPNLSLIRNDSQAAIWTNETAIVSPSRELQLTWDKPGKKVGPDLAYTTTQPKSNAKWAAHVTQLNVTYTKLFNVTKNSAVTYIPDENPPPLSGVEGSITTLNDTNFLLITADNPFVTSFNLSALNDYIVAGPAIVQYG